MWWTHKTKLLSKIFVLVETKDGRDFSQIKLFNWSQKKTFLNFKHKNMSNMPL